MARSPVSVRLEGVRALTRAIAKVNPLLRKELGRKNKAIGARVIAKSVPRPVQSGRGAGAIPRPSANANVLAIRAGGGWRDSHKEQWGPRFAQRFTPRPYIAEAGEHDMPQIEKDYLDALATVARQAGLRFIRK